MFIYPTEILFIQQNSGYTTEFPIKLNCSNSVYLAEFSKVYYMLGTQDLNISRTWSYSHKVHKEVRYSNLFGPHNNPVR